MRVDGVFDFENDDAKARVFFGNIEDTGVWFGHFEGVYNDRICEETLAIGTKCVQRHGRTRFFFDWSRLRRYDSSARASATSWCVRHRQNILGIDFLTDSGFIQMGIRVANMVMKARLDVHDRQSDFLNQMRMLLGKDVVSDVSVLSDLY